MVCVDGVQVLEVFSMLVHAYNNVEFFVVWGEVGDSREAFMDVNGACCISGRNQDVPGFVAKATNEEGFGGF
jgi:hypothetical protein